MRRPAAVHAFVLSMAFTALGWTGAANAPAAGLRQQGRAPDPGWFELPVPGGLTTLERLGLRREEHGIAFPLIARALHGAAASASSSLAVTFTEIFGPVTLQTTPPIPTGGEPAVVLAPFSEEVWRPALQIDRRADLFTAIAKNRGALLVAAGALQGEAGTRQWLGGRIGLLQQIIKLWPGAFALLAPALSLRDGRIAVPGGAPFEAVWTALVGASPARAEEFLLRLLARDEGRLARFFVLLHQLGEPMRSAILAPLPGETPAAALATLYQLSREAEPVWAPNVHPYQLSYADLWSLLWPLDGLDPSRLPNSAGHWAAVLRSEIGSRRAAADLLSHRPVGPPLAASVRALLDGPPRERRDRVALLALARQVWSARATGSDEVDIVYALGHFRRFRTLLLTLDGLGVTTPSTWASAVDAARRVDEDGGAERAETLAIFQGAVAIVGRAGRVRSLSAADAGRVLDALFASVERGPDVGRAVASWMIDTLFPALPPLRRPDRFTGRTAYESRVMQALGGVPPSVPTRLVWEGQTYTVDVSAAEHERILQIRERLPSPGLDAALESRDRRALARAMTAMVYAPALGDPEGAVTLSPDVVERHDFGQLTRASAGREFGWLPPQERTGTGLGWHAAGSLLLLDLAFARLSLRRLSADDMPPIPTINLNDQLTLARTAVAMDPWDLTDADRDRIAQAIDRGRARVAAAGRDPAAVERLAREAAISDAQISVLPWTLAHAPDAQSLFGLRDLLWLGQPDISPDALGRWGLVGDVVDGRPVPRFDRPLPWERLAGRPETGVMASQVPDLTLRLVEATARMKLPADLLPALLLYATQDYWHEVEARFADDWPAMTRGALALTDARIGDYVAALGSRGPLRPE